MYGQTQKNTAKGKQSIIYKYVKSKTAPKQKKKVNHMDIFIKKSSKKV